MAVQILQPQSLRTRSYQQEMFERSMMGNVIVALDTGAGKTLIAALRIKAELEQCTSEKLVWFLSPGVELCHQQEAFLAAFLPAFKTRSLTGADNVDCWKDQRIWDNVLDQVRVVVSTPAVLTDALGHTYVKMSRLALLVFDEAHHCYKKHPYSVIMRMFYHPAKLNDKSSVPHILGLSASPIIRSNINKLREIEANLDSITVTPRAHRQELLKYVNHPTYRILQFQPEDHDHLSRPGDALQALSRATQLPNAMANVHMSTAQISQHDYSVATPLEQHLRRFQSKAFHLKSELGSWAAEYFVLETIQVLKNSLNGQCNFLVDIKEQTKVSILNLLDKPHLRSSYDKGKANDEYDVSSKAAQLISFLTEPTSAGSRCIVFVQQRATTAVLCHLLSTHPLTKFKYRCAPFVGTSNIPSRRYALNELLDLSAQKNILSQFRNGEINLLIATNTLEEGIDVQSCNLVICFDPPANLKSFIQRRGRARQQSSVLAILTSTEDKDQKVEKWKALEAQLIRICQEDRELVEASDSDDIEEDMHLALVHPKSGAIITADMAVQHLHHFCDLLPPQPYIDLRPIYAYENNGNGSIQASVTLPSCVLVSVRHARSKRCWASEKAARKDAAFQSYSALYEAGLLNEHLLPLSHDWGPVADYEGLEPGLAEVSSQLDLWNTDAEMTFQYQSLVTIKKTPNGDDATSIVLTTSNPVPRIPALSLRWSNDEVYCIELGPSVMIQPPDAEKIKAMQESTMVLYKSTRSDRRDLSRPDFVALISPSDAEITFWLKENSGSVPAETVYAEISPIQRLIRVPLPNNPPFIFHEWGVDSTNAITVSCEPLKRRRAWLTRLQNPENKYRDKTSARRMTFLARDCTIGRMDVRYTRLSLCLPNIFYRIGDYMTAQHLRDTVLASIPYNDVSHTVTAIRAPAANREANYQRYEFVGDCVLKFQVSKYLYVAHPNWPEGFLTKRRVHLTCNGRLASEAIRVGLDKYIITTPLHHREWNVPTRQAQSFPPTRMLSPKTLADVVEALIGATLFDTNKTRDIITLFLPAIPPIDPPFLIPPELPVPLPPQLQDAEVTIGHTFTHKILLLEALTHSGAGPSQTYQRLEFLGDAVLDYIVVQHLLMHCSDQKTQADMTRLRAAVVNSHLLGYFCLAYPGDDNGDQAGEHKLWHFLRHESSELTKAQIGCSARFVTHGTHIMTAMTEKGGEYLWLELAELRPDKFYSDLIESVIGAVFVDSGGNWDPCEKFLTRLGLLDYLEQLVRNSVDVFHPRDNLQRAAGSKEVKFEIQRGIDGLFAGTLSLDENVRANVHGCQTREVAIIKLSYGGISWLEGRSLASL